MNQLFRAVESLGPDIVLVKDNKIVCKVEAFGAHRGQISVRLYKEDYERLVKPLRESCPDDLCQYTVFRFGQHTGTFLETNIDPGDIAYERVDKFFEEARIVSEFNLRYGLVPESFKGVEGYKSGLESEEDAA